MGRSNDVARGGIPISMWESGLSVQTAAMDTPHCLVHDIPGREDCVRRYAG